jgi:hypothetical protein
MKVNFKKKPYFYIFGYLPTWTMHTSLANFLKIWSNCGYWKSPKETLVLSTFYFSISHSGYIYIYIATAKKEGIGSLVVNNPPTRAVAGNGPTRAVRWQWSGRPSWFSGGTIRFLSAETRLRSSAGPAAACSKLPSSSPTRLPLKTGGSLVESSKESYI